MLSSLFWVLVVAAAAQTTVMPDSKGAKGSCEGDDCTTPEPKMAVTGDDMPESKGSEGDAPESKSASGDAPESKSGSSSQDAPVSKSGGGDMPQHGWMPPTVSGMTSCDDLLDAAMGGSVENPDFSLDGDLFLDGSEETTSTSLPWTTMDERDGVIHPECLHSALMSGDLTGSSMCNGVDFMGIHTVATEACMAESVDGVAASSMISCVDGTGYIYEWDSDDCSGDGAMTEASEFNMTVNCDAFAGDCDYLTIRRGESGEEDTCSYENYYDMAITMNDCYDIGGLGVAFVSMSCEDEELVVSEYLEDGCTGTPLNVTTQHLNNPTGNEKPDGKSSSGSKSASQSGSKSASEDAPASKSGSEDAPASKSGSEDAPESKSAEDASGDAPDSKTAPDSKEGGERRRLASTTPEPKGAKGCDGDDCTTPEPKMAVTGDDMPDSKGSEGDDAPESKSASGDAPESKSGSQDAPESKSGSESGDAPDSKEGAGGIETECIEIVYCSTTGYSSGSEYSMNSGAGHLAASVWMVVAAYFVM